MIKEVCSFWCSGCKIRHPGECPPAVAAPPASDLHDWYHLPQTDLTHRAWCKKCHMRYRKSLIETLEGRNPFPPVSGCLGKPPF